MPYPIPSSYQAQRAAAGPHGTHPAIIWLAVFAALTLLCGGAFGVAFLLVLLRLV